LAISEPSTDEVVKFLSANTLGKLEDGQLQDVWDAGYYASNPLWPQFEKLEDVNRALLPPPPSEFYFFILAACVLHGDAKADTIGFPAPPGFPVGRFRASRRGLEKLGPDSQWTLVLARPVGIIPAISFLYFTTVAPSLDSGA